MQWCIFDRPLKAWKRVCATGTVLRGSGGGHRHKGSTPNSCIGIGVRHITAGMPPASFALLLQICPLQGRSAKRGPIWLSARRSTGMVTPSKSFQRSAGANRAEVGGCLPTVPLLLRIRCIAGFSRLGSTYSRTLFTADFRKAKEAADAASLEPSKRFFNVGFFILGPKGGPPATL